jgi:hypothetical protein
MTVVSSPCQRQGELLPSLGVRCPSSFVRRLSSINYSHINLGEATNTNFIFFCLTRPKFVPTIYRIRGEHANHYATDAVPYFYFIFIILLITYNSFSLFAMQLD